MTLVKSAPKKRFAQKTDCFRTFSLGKIIFRPKLFLCALFTKVICTFFEISTKRRIFDAPFDLLREKKFSSLRGDNELFLELKKVKNGRNHSKFRKTVFYKQILDFHCPSKILCHIEIMKFCQNHWPLAHSLDNLMKGHNWVLNLEINQCLLLISYAKSLCKKRHC